MPACKRPTCHTRTLPHHLHTEGEERARAQDGEAEVEKHIGKTSREGEKLFGYVHTLRMVHFMHLMPYLR